LSTRIPESEKTEAPRRKLVANLVDRGLREIESYKADLADADNLETRINEENQHLVYLLQDLKEQEGVLELNRQLQLDLLQRKHQERLSQLDRYRDLKNSESQVQRLIGDFNARKELEKAVEQERIVAKEMRQGPFAKRRGMLPLPVAGNIISNFGRVFDAKSNLHVFRKGIEIAAGARQEVHAISAGRIAYSGELPNYGRVAIVDHGDHFYSLCANLGSLSRKMGEAVAAGETIGVSDDAGAPVYFEIRARNIAVNPLQWVSN
jgi:septal ring factor EnvC (AmiA/AmiB activator)